MASITGATSAISIIIPGVFPSPQQLQGFAADDVFEGDPIESNEVLMGVDGILSGGFVYVPIQQNFALQADSPSIYIFDNWWNYMQAAQDVFPANATIKLTVIGKTYTMTKGFLTNYKPIPDIKKLLQPQRFRITWQSVSPQFG
jgi:hypothetical protein